GEDRDADRGAGGDVPRVVATVVGIERAAAVADAGVYGHARQPLGAGPGDAGAARLLGELGGAESRIVALDGVEHLVGVGRQQAGQRRLGLQLAGILAHHGGVVGPAGGQLRLGELVLRLGRGQARFGLGDVGAGDLAHLEAGLRFLELPPEDLDVFLTDAQSFLVAPHVDVGGDDVLKNLLLDTAKVLTPRQHLGLGGGHVGGDAAAGPDRLGQPQGHRTAGLLGAAVSVGQAVAVEVCAGARLHRDARSAVGGRAAEAD